jgi:hypothetical protein
VIEATSGVLILGSIAWLGLWPGAALGMGLITLGGCAVIGLAVRRKLAGAMS